MKTLTYETPVYRTVHVMERCSVKLTKEVRRALKDWMANAAYIGSNGNYRLKSDKRRYAPWNAAAKKAFSGVDALHSAAHAARAAGLI
jgi:hypothetical protein